MHICMQLLFHPSSDIASILTDPKLKRHDVHYKWLQIVGYLKTETIKKLIMYFLQILDNFKQNIQLLS